MVQGLGKVGNILRFKNREATVERIAIEELSSCICTCQD
jgi:hypothetical protein